MYVLTKEYFNYDDYAFDVLYVSSDKERAEAKIKELTERLALIAKLQDQVKAEVHQWEITNHPAHFSDGRVKSWSEWARDGLHTKSYEIRKQKIAALTQEHNLPKHWDLWNREWEYLICEVEEI